MSKQNVKKGVLYILYALLDDKTSLPVLFFLFLFS